MWQAHHEKTSVQAGNFMASPIPFLYEIKVKKEEESKGLLRFQLSKVISLHHVDDGELLPSAILMGVG